MNRAEAEEFVYQFYMEAAPKQDYNAKDSMKRHPELTREVIESKSGTPCVVVTGSKGKGSVANMISAILQSAYRVGLMTSPHIYNFCERFRINGERISDEAFAEEMTSVKEEIEEIAKGLSEGEAISPMGIQTNLALKYFNDNHTTFNVLECGKGARYDDVNNAIHQFAVITPVFPEHIRELGDTIEEIAEDKSYVIKEGMRAVYIAKQEPSVMDIFIKRVERYGVSVKIYGRDFRAENVRYAGHGMKFDVVLKEKKYTNLEIPLLGEHQAENCALALAMCSDIIKEPETEAVKQRLATLKWEGRTEIISEKPFILLDACITRESCKNVKKVLQKKGIRKVIAIIGIPDDKDYFGVVEEIAPLSVQILLTGSKNPHYIFTNKQETETRKKGFRTKWMDSLDKAIGEAEKEALKEDAAIVILGTTSVVSEVKKMKRKSND